MKFLVKEISLTDYRHTRKWIVDIDCGEDFNYRGRTSVNAFFFSGKKNRNYSKTSLYYGEPLEEAIEVRDFDPTGVEQVETIWKFYEIIGYDYKTKKYSKELPVNP